MSCCHGNLILDHWILDNYFRKRGKTPSTSPCTKKKRLEGRKDEKQGKEEMQEKDFKKNLKASGGYMCMYG